MLSINRNVGTEVDENSDDPRRLFGQCETSIFSKVVYTAEKVGKPVSPVAAAGRDPYSLILQAAQKLRSSRIVISQSSRVSLAEQKDEIIRAWNELKAPKIDVTVEIVVPDEVTQPALRIQLGEQQKAG